MTGDLRFWEERFVDAYVTETKRSRYKQLLKNPKKRRKILDRLNHCADFEFEKAVRLTGAQSFADHVMQELFSHNIEAHCWLISYDSDLDGKRLPVRQAACLTTMADWGTVMICPPKPVAVYRAEASESALFLFS